VARVCTVCRHPSRTEIDRQLAAGASFRGLSAVFRVSEDALRRHKERHLPAALAKAYEQDALADVLDLAYQLKAVNGATIGVLADARNQRQPALVLAAADRVLRQLEFYARIVGQLRDGQAAASAQVNVLLAPSAEWLEVRTAVLDALAPYPDARAAVAARLRAVSGEDGTDEPEAAG
jgi:hypothetical protein